MADPGWIADHQAQAVDQIRSVLRKHGAQEVQQRVEARQAYPASQWSVRDNTVTGADVFLMMLAEDVADLAKLLDPILEDRKPKKRGRPRKDDKAA
jgi:hypothetical protein